ncbi:MAG TPA: AAA family ATPase, partial [Geminicoccaceae bacterium]|nr:AAA family ATPase [Geminicoccaceae bacterium]
MAGNGRLDEAIEEAMAILAKRLPERDEGPATVEHGAEVAERIMTSAGAKAGGGRAAPEGQHAAERDPSPLAFDLDDWDTRTAFAGEAPKQEWLIERGIPRGVAGLVASAGDTGKSFTLLELCLRVTGGPLGGLLELQDAIFGGAVTSHGAAVFVTAEDGRGSVHRRLQALDPDGSRRAARRYPLYVIPLPDAGGPFPIVVEERGKVIPTAQFTGLRERLRAIPDLALVVLDPLQCFVHADVNADPQAAAITMSLLNMLAAETGATALAAHHVRKEREPPKNAAEARHAIRGSSALVDQSRVAVVLWTPDEARVRHVCKALEVDFAPNAVVQGAVVKSNDGASRKEWTLLRDPTGALRDVTAALGIRRASRADLGEALVKAGADGASTGRPFTRTGVNGLYERRAELGEIFADVAKHILVKLADDLLQA